MKDRETEAGQAYCLFKWLAIFYYTFHFKKFLQSQFPCINLGEPLHLNGFHAGKLHFGVTKGLLMLYHQLTKLVSTRLVLHLD